MKQRKNSTILLITFWMFASYCYALPEDQNLPIKITSKEGSYNQETGMGVYKDDVIMTQGTLEIKADIATFNMVDDELNHVEATGNLIKIKYLPELDKPWIYGEGLELEYKPKEDLLILKKNAKITQDKDTMVADKIEYNIKTKKMRALSNSNKDRIIFKIEPKGTK